MKKKWLDKTKENGSISIEFLGILPIFLLFVALFWQFLVTGFALMTVQSAVNEAAMVYSARQVVSNKREMRLWLFLRRLAIISNSMKKRALFP
ncbi:TadE family protein [Aureibacillus halotolerans]|uniref:TadE family protein n=1 Tax=Aureibacillus halotolerans TaxID=1508390 RepID=UPI0010605607